MKVVNELPLTNGSVGWKGGIKGGGGCEVSAGLQWLFLAHVPLQPWVSGGGLLELNG